MTKDKRRRPKHYDRPGYRPGPEGQGSYVDQKGAADAREQIEDVRWPPTPGIKAAIRKLGPI